MLASLIKNTGITYWLCHFCWFCNSIGSTSSSFRKIGREKNYFFLFIIVQHTKCYSELFEGLPENLELNGYWNTHRTQRRILLSQSKWKDRCQAQKIPQIIKYSFNITLFCKVAVKVDYLFVGGNTKPNAITAPFHFKRSCTMSKCFIPIIYLTFYFSVCLFLCV